MENEPTTRTGSAAGIGSTTGSMGSAGGNELRNLTEQIEEGIRTGKYTWRDIQHAVMQKTRQAAETTDTYVHENPWQVVGIAGAFGFLLGLLMAPRSDE